MASARLLNYWWPRRGATPLCGVVARATVRGESMGAILELGARSLLEAGAADRAAVWLQSAHHPEIYQGAIVEAGSGIVPEEWKQLDVRSEEHTSELQSLRHLVCRLLLEKKKRTHIT